MCLPLNPLLPPAALQSPPPLFRLPLLNPFSALPVVVLVAVAIRREVNRTDADDSVRGDDDQNHQGRCGCANDRWWPHKGLPLFTAQNLHVQDFGLPVLDLCQPHLQLDDGASSSSGTASPGLDGWRSRREGPFPERASRG